MKIQDAYILGMCLHRKLTDRKLLDGCKTQGEFNRIWKEAIEDVRKIVENDKIDLIDACKDTDWNYYDLNDLPGGSGLGGLSVEDKIKIGAGVKS